MIKNNLITKIAAMISTRPSYALFFILKRYLLLSWISQKKLKQGSAVSVLVPLSGITIGVAAFLVVISVMSGFVESIEKNIFQSQAHLILKPQPGTDIAPADAENLIQKIKNFSSEIVHISPFYQSDIIIQSSDGVMIASLEGIDPKSKYQPFDVNNILNDSDETELLEQKVGVHFQNNELTFNTILVGQDILDQLHINIGDRITLVSPNFQGGFTGFSPNQIPVVVAGNLNTGRMIYDKKKIFSSQHTFFSILSDSDYSQGFFVVLKNPMNAQKISDSLQKHLAKLNLYAEPWTTPNKSLLKALTFEHYGMIFMLAMIVVVGCFSITISLSMSVRRKIKDMAILRSLGFEKKDLYKLFIWKGIIIGICGIIGGFILGGTILFLIYTNKLPILTSPYSSQSLPIVFHISDLFFIILTTIICSFVAAFWPAYQTQKFNIIEILSVKK